MRIEQPGLTKRCSQLAKAFGVAYLFLVRSMARFLTTILCFAVLDLVGATTSSAGMTAPPSGVAYAIYAAKPCYPVGARLQHHGGSGIFLVHIRADGTVRAVDTVKSTGYVELDACAIDAFRKWRFRSGRPTQVKIPITFSVRGPVLYEWGPHGAGN